MGAATSRAPFSAQSSCQGTMLEWCSRVVTTTSSPAPTWTRPKVWATRLTASVAPRTKITSRLSALRNLATVARAPSKARVARSDRACTPRWTLALSRS